MREAGRGTREPKCELRVAKRAHLHFAIRTSHLRPASRFPLPASRTPDQTARSELPQAIPRCALAESDAAVPYGAPAPDPSVSAGAVAALRPVAHVPDRGIDRVRPLLRSSRCGVARRDRKRCRAPCTHPLSPPSSGRSWCDSCVWCIPGIGGTGSAPHGQRSSSATPTTSAPALQPASPAPRKPARKVRAASTRPRSRRTPAAPRRPPAPGETDRYSAGSSMTTIPPVPRARCALHSAGSAVCRGTRARSRTGTQWR